MSTEEYRASLKEKIPYGMYFFGQGMIYTLVSQYLMMYSRITHICLRWSYRLSCSGEKSGTVSMTPCSG